MTKKRQGWDSTNSCHTLTKTMNRKNASLLPICEPRKSSYSQSRVVGLRMSNRLKTWQFEAHD